VFKVGVSSSFNRPINELWGVVEEKPLLTREFIVIREDSRSTFAETNRFPRHAYDPSSFSRRVRMPKTLVVVVFE
jgi:hypothetical protein